MEMIGIARGRASRKDFILSLLQILDNFRLWMLQFISVRKKMVQLLAYPKIDFRKKKPRKLRK